MSDAKAAVGTVPHTSKSAKTSASGETAVSKGLRRPEDMHHVIAVAAYYLAERRNFEPGYEMEDWLNA